MDPKKSQQNAKKLVNAFGKEVTSWHHLNEQILMLLEALLKCTLVALTVSSYHSSESERSLSETEALKLSIFKTFPDLFDRLQAQFLQEREDYCCQLKKIVNYMGDVAVAMQLTGNEVMSFVYNESLSSWVDVGEDISDSRVFNVDHMLDIIDLHGMFLCEFRRKQLVIHGMLLKQLEQVETIPAGDGGAAAAVRGEAHVQLIKHAIAQWSTLQVKTNENILNMQDIDNSMCCIDNARLLSFLEANNIKMD